MYNKNLSVDLLKKLFPEFLIIKSNNHYRIFKEKYCNVIVIDLDIDGNVEIYYHQECIYSGQLNSLNKKEEIYSIPVFIFICILFIKNTCAYISEKTSLSFSDLNMFSKFIVSKNFTLNTIIHTEDLLNDESCICHLFSDVKSGITGYFLNTNTKELYSYKINKDKIDELYDYVNNAKYQNELSDLFATDQSILKSMLEDEAFFVAADLLKYYEIKESLPFFEIEKVQKDVNNLLNQISKIIQLEIFDGE